MSPSATQSAVQTNVNSKSSSYAAIAMKDQFPKRDQGLIIDCVEGVNLAEYTYAIGDIVQPKMFFSHHEYQIIEFAYIYRIKTS